MNAIDKRLQELRAEFDRGQKQLDRFDSQRNDARDTLLRISGAIQVLEELLKEEKHAHIEGAFPADGVPVGSAER